MWSSEYRRALANPRSLSLASMRVLVGFPNRKSVAESSVQRWNSGCMSTTVAPSPGSRRNRRATCDSMRPRSATCSVAKLGRSRARGRAHSSPSLAETPWPSSGPMMRCRPPRVKSLEPERQQGLDVLWVRGDYGPAVEAAGPPRSARPRGTCLRGEGLEEAVVSEGSCIGDDEV